MLRAAWLAPLALFAPRAAADNACHVVDVAFTPTDNLQIAAWVEKPDGTYVDTVYVTRKIGSDGLGNRPGRFDFNSGPMWPYGRRTTALPVWAHRHGHTFPQVTFQIVDTSNNHLCCGDEDNLSHAYMASSIEHAYCRPLMPSEFDAMTCPSASFTDKGIFHPTATSVYPPRSDIGRSGTDAPSVDQYKAMNPFDAVSQATPAGGACAQFAWPIPASLPLGDYVLWIEVGKEFDMNATYNDTTYPAPTGIPWTNYGKPYRGQPSIVYKTPFTIAMTETRAAAQTYVGYGDPDGGDGTLRAPDATITTDTPGSGAARLLLIAGSSDRVRVHARSVTDTAAPAAPSDFALASVTPTSATIQFASPGDDGQVGSVSSYEIRLRANDEMTADTFGDAVEVKAMVTPGSAGDCGVDGGFPPAGSAQAFDLAGLLPETDYWIGVRAFDKCHNPGELAIFKFTTPAQLAGEVDACFIATAAYGTAMANDIDMLRRFRDHALRSSALGELAVEAYYTFGPALAGMVGESQLLRAGARSVLAPLVRRIQPLAY